MLLGDPRDVRRLMSLSQIGFEMVAPIGVGVALDLWLGWLPWGVLVGVVLGLSVGLVHLVYIVNQENADSARRPPAPDRREAP